MTDYQNELVMEHLDLVNWVIRTRISVPNRPLLTYDDFYAIGCEAICRAALKYQADSGEFAPFACRYIYNAIIDHCRAMNYRLQRSVDAGFEEGEVLFDLLAHTTVDFEAEVTDDRAEDGRLFLVVHSGSRHLGTEVANFYQDEGRRALWGGAHYQIKATIDQMKAEGRFKEIQKTITALKREHDLSIPKDLAYVEGALFDDYIHDMKLTQKFAILNRKAMVDVILSGMGLTPVDEFTTIHNYIDTDAMILRKGSVSARKGEKLLIPINMRDGSLICIGKGNEEWNCSAPHGAGRLMSRHAAFQALSMEEFQKEMEGIYTTCVVPDTLDESPMAYKSMDEIIDQIEPTVEIVQRIRPVYNFKASD